MIAPAVGKDTADNYTHGDFCISGIGRAFTDWSCEGALHFTHWVGYDAEDILGHNYGFLLINPGT